MDDNILPFIRKCLAGDSASWDEIVSIVLQKLRHQDPSLPLEDQEDLVQTICEKLLTGLRTFHGTSKYELLGYLRTATYREATSLFRRNARRRTTVSLDDPLDDESGETLHDLIPDLRPDPHKIAELNDLYQRAGDLLSIRDRQILMYKAQKYKDREIAEILNIPMGTVAVSYHRIKELLAATLVVIFLILFERKLP